MLPSVVLAWPAPEIIQLITSAENWCRHSMSTLQTKLPNQQVQRTLASHCLRTGEPRQLGHPEVQDVGCSPLSGTPSIVSSCSQLGYTGMAHRAVWHFRCWLYPLICVQQSQIKQKARLQEIMLWSKPLIFQWVNLNLLHRTVPSCFLDDAWSPVDEPSHAREHGSSWLSFVTHQCLELDADDWSCSILVTATEIPTFIQPMFLQRPQQPSNMRKGFRCLLWPTSTWTHHPSVPLACTVTWNAEFLCTQQTFLQRWHGDTAHSGAQSWQVTFLLPNVPVWNPLCEKHLAALKQHLTDCPLHLSCCGWTSNICTSAIDEEETTTGSWHAGKASP